MAEMCTAPTFLAAAEALWRAPAAELRLNEQVPIRKCPLESHHGHHLTVILAKELFA